MPDYLRRFGEPKFDSAGQPIIDPTTGMPQYYFSNVRSGLIVAILSIGTLMGALIAAPIADKIGRKPSISIAAFVAIVGFIIQITSEMAWYQITIGRLVAGLGIGALSLLVPMYQAETAPAWIRGALVCSYQLFITMGIFLAACFNYGTYKNQMNSSASWRIVLGIGFLWAIGLGIGIQFFPETPRYDFSRGKRERAIKTLCDVHGTSENHYAVYSQVKDIETQLRAEDHIKLSPVAEFASMFTAPRMLPRLLLGCSLQMFQILTGANYFFYYGTVIFRSVQINSFITQIIINTINFLSTFLGLYIIEHYGRRKCLIAGSGLMFVCFMIYASVGHFSLDQQNPQDTPKAGIALIVFSSIFILGFATTWGPIIWAILAEIFPSRYRAKAMGLATASNWTWNFCVGFFTPFITQAIDFRYGYVFAACNLLAGLIVYFFVIEGQGRTIEEIDTMYLMGVTPWKSTEWVRPSDEKMAQIRREAGVDLNAMVEDHSSVSDVAKEPKDAHSQADTEEATTSKAV